MSSVFTSPLASQKVTENCGKNEFKLRGTILNKIAS